MKDSLTIDLSYFGYTIIGVTMGIYSIGEKQTDFAICWFVLAAISLTIGIWKIYKQINKHKDKPRINASKGKKKSKYQRVNYKIIEKDRV